MKPMPEPSPQTDRHPPARYRALSLAGLAAIVLLLTLWMLLGAAQAPALAGGSYTVLQNYFNPTPAAGEEYGSALAYLPGGDQLIVGARSDQFTTTVVGQAFILDANSGTVDALLHAPAPQAGERFGFSVAAAITKVVIGAPNTHIVGPATNDGAVYLFDASNGNFVHYYPNPNTIGGDQFGSSVAIISDTIVIGAPQFDAPSAQSNAGRVYLCTTDLYDCPIVLDNPSPGSVPGSDQFGLSLVSFPGGFAVGAPLDGSHGTVYVYSYNGVTATVSAVISTTQTGTGDEFGRALAYVNGKLLIGAANDNTGAADAGVAYLYTLTGTQIISFTNPTPNSTDHFGAAVGGNNSLIAIGAPDDDQAGTDAGAVHLYDANTYAFLQTVTDPSPANNEKFGFAVFGLGSDVAVSALNDNQGAAGAGAVYRVGYDAAPPTPTNTATATATATEAASGYTPYLPITWGP